jgi:hypothetical protein
MATKFGNIQICGTGQFVNATVAALSLLQPSQRHFGIIEDNLEIVKFLPKSRLRGFADAEALPSDGLKSVHVYSHELVLSCKYAFALLLAHEAYHNYIYTQFMRLGNRRLWKWHRRFYRNRDEYRCQKFEIQICNELGFPDDLREWKETSIFAIPHGLPRKQIRILNHLRRLSLKCGDSGASG